MAASRTPGGAPCSARRRWRREPAPRPRIDLPLPPGPSMKLVQILLPVRDNRGRKFKRALYAGVHKELVRRFGGLTAYTRSPARGLWRDEGTTKRDDVIILEVMA